MRAVMVRPPLRQWRARKHLIRCGQPKDPGHLAARADERQQAAFRAELSVRPHDLMERSGVDEREPGDVHQERARLLRGFRAENFRQRRFPSRRYVASVSKEGSPPGSSAVSEAARRISVASESESFRSLNRCF